MICYDAWNGEEQAEEHHPRRIAKKKTYTKRRRRRPFPAPDAFNRNWFLLVHKMGEEKRSKSNRIGKFWNFLFFEKKKKKMESGGINFWRWVTIGRPLICRNRLHHHRWEKSLFEQKENVDRGGLLFFLSPPPSPPPVTVRRRRTPCPLWLSSRCDRHRQLGPVILPIISNLSALLIGTYTHTGADKKCAVFSSSPFSPLFNYNWREETSSATHTQTWLQQITTKKQEIRSRSRERTTSSFYRNPNAMAALCSDY